MGCNPKPDGKKGIFMIQEEKLFSRDEFRQSVLERDNFLCVICGAKAQDAHHILERKLFANGGYYLSNGASVCGDCHIKCEQTLISVEQLREAAGIKKYTIPDQLYPDQSYDKWGNIILSNGQRLRGELFYDESVQKVLGEGALLKQFTNYVKYSRSYHVPWSPGIHKDDRALTDMDCFEGQDVVVTLKMDGENTSMYHDYIHARSIASSNHASRDWVKSFHAKLAYNIPLGYRICGENLYAKHSIYYDNLNSFFYGFSVWNEKNICLSWNETLEWFELLDLISVPVLYQGNYNKDELKKIEKNLDFHQDEGYVIRLHREFSYGEFRKSVAKFVRTDHIKTTQHWLNGKPIEPNRLNQS